MASNSFMELFSHVRWELSAAQPGACKAGQVKEGTMRALQLRHENVLIIWNQFISTALLCQNNQE